ncbi:hypothetical protein PAEH1_02770 [Paenalcaligenes hominis]|uniref:HTH cro/C1-type domain-containing protein n=1 Tax=Paenalcaligenes hominis TaxID=643674 RepID=A0A1U9JYA9_9BURK|nr:hypothetical protein PAEH1_02770 [Paenalcaligenes hominis]
MTKTSKELAEEIIAAGMTQTEIAERVGATQATVSKLVRGGIADISYAIGKRLELLHKEKVASGKRVINAKSQPQAPTHPESSSTPTD